MIGPGTPYPETPDKAVIMKRHNFLQNNDKKISHIKEKNNFYFKLSKGISDGDWHPTHDYIQDTSWLKIRKVVSTNF